MSVPPDHHGAPDCLPAGSRPGLAGPDQATLEPAAGNQVAGYTATTMLRHVVAAARALAEADGAAILLHDRENDLFVPTVPSVAVGLDERWLQRQGLEASQVLATRATDAQNDFALSDTTTDPDLEYPLLAGAQRPATVCVLPLWAEDTIVGVIELFDATPRTSPYPLEGLRTFAALAGLAIANATAHEREQALRARLEAVDEASKALAAELSLDQVLQRIVQVAVRLVGARYGALGVLGSDGYLADFITTGIAAEERAQIGPLPRGHGLLGVLIREGRPLRVPAIQGDPRRVGFPPHHPPMTSLLGVPIRARTEIVGDLYLTDKIDASNFSDDDQRVIEMLAAHAGLAIENARLYAQVGELTLLHERERIGRDLHDGIIQDIYAATLQLENLSEDVQDREIQTRLLETAQQLDRVIGDVRTYIQALRARELEGRLLSEGIMALVQGINGRNGLTVTFSMEGAPYRLPDAEANALVQIVREALSNVVKHAQATEAHVQLSYAAQHVSLAVVDNGRGFDQHSARGEEHHGLRNLRARAEEMGGTSSVESALGVGTTIRVSVPPPF